VGGLSYADALVSGKEALIALGERTAYTARGTVEADTGVYAEAEGKEAVSERRTTVRSTGVGISPASAPFGACGHRTEEKFRRCTRCAKAAVGTVGRYGECEHEKLTA